MNLRQAYDGWSQQEQNRQLYIKTRDAFRRAWFTLPTNKPCSWYTKDVLALALAETRVVESDKVKAASVMVHVLTWANFAEPKWNPKPDFRMEALTRLIHLPADKLEKERERITAAVQQMPDIEEPPTDGSSTGDADKSRQGQPSDRRSERQQGAGDATADPIAAESSIDENIDPLEGIDFPDENETTEPQNNENMEQQKRQRGKAPKPVAQIDPETMKVVKVWPSRGAAESELGACNLDRCIAKLRKSAGFYWSDPKDADTFADRLKQRQDAQPKPKADKKAKEEQPAPDAVPASVAAHAVTPKFKTGDHVWAKQPKALAGRTGYVKAVDTYKMEYMVLFDKDVWIVPEDDLELVTPSSEVIEIKTVTDDLGQQRQCFEMPKHGKPLADYSDDELLAELDRRGFEGELSRRVTYTIGSK